MMGRQYDEVSEKPVQIKAKGNDANWSRDCIVFFALSVVIRKPEQHFALTRVKHAALIRIAPFWASKLDRIWMNFAQIGQTWRVSWGLHTLEADITTLGIIARMRKDFRFIFISIRSIFVLWSIFGQYKYNKSWHLAET